MGEDSQGVTDLCRVFRSQIPLGSQVILAKALLEEGADVDKGLPLFCAASASNFKAVKLLIEHGADIHAKDWEGRTPLHSASTYSDNQTASTIRLLIEKGVDVNVNDDYGVTPLHIAGSMSNGTAAEVLIEHGADVNAKGQYPYETPLHAVISGSCGGFDNIVKLLIAHGADLNARNIENKTPLQALREGGCEESDITHGTMLLSR